MVLRIFWCFSGVSYLVLMLSQINDWASSVKRSFGGIQFIPHKKDMELCFIRHKQSIYVKIKENKTKRHYKQCYFCSHVFHLFSRARHSTSSSTGESTQDDTEMMDDHMAAMVLTSLSVSPVSPVFPQSPFDHLRGKLSYWMVSQYQK